MLQFNDACPSLLKSNSLPLAGKHKAIRDEDWNGFFFFLLRLRCERPIEPTLNPPGAVWQWVESPAARFFCYNTSCSYLSPGGDCAGVGGGWGRGTAGGHRGSEGDKWGRKDGRRRHRRSDRKWPLLLGILLGWAGRVTGRTSAAQARHFGEAGGSGVFTQQ